MNIELNASNWRVIASDGVQAELKSTMRDGKAAICIDFSFNGAGHAIARLPLPLTMPENYCFDFEVKGEGPSNTLEFKVIDESGDNVWWVNRSDFAFPADWTRLTNKRRHFSYAWGPDRNHPQRIAHIEFVITASSGGKGSVCFSELNFEVLPAVQDEVARPTATASSAKDAAHVVVDGQGQSIWQSTGDKNQWLMLDFEQRREFGGLVIDWGVNHAQAFDVETTLDGKVWQTVRSIKDSNGKRDYVYLPECEATAVRLSLRKTKEKGAGFAIRQVSVQGLSFSAGMNDFWRAVAKDNRAGHYPHYFQDEHTYFTVVGASGDTANGLVGEEGSVEFGAKKASVEPFLYSEGRLLTWREAVHDHSLLDGYLPIPSVVRRHPGLELDVQTWVDGEPGHAVVYIRYVIENTDDRKRSGKLFLALRPFQVNPPWQFLNTPGGFSPIRKLVKERDTVLINDDTRVIALDGTSRWGCTTLSRGDISEYLDAGTLPAEAACEDELGLSSGALSYDFALKPGQTKLVHLAVPLHSQWTTPLLSPKKSLTRTQKWWKDKLARIDITLPWSARHVANTIKSQAAYILINRHGSGIQPGSRSYRRTWIRDGALTSAALLQLGYIEEVRDFIEWFAPFQYANGKVPCCVDKRGADPTPEHDSHGEFIYLLSEYFRYTGDKELLRKYYRGAVAAADYIDKLRGERLTADYQTDEKRHLYGILPESISHEGYSAKPAHSYWDDLWALKGLKDVVAIALALGETDDLQRLTALRDQFRKDLLASIVASMRKHNIDYIPGAADLGDFDATSTTIGLDPAFDLVQLDEQLRSTFERYWDFFKSRRDGMVEWEAYTPYELRSVGAFLRLGKAEQAHELLDFFMNDRRPAGWNHWGEVVYRDPRTPKFIGDAPHTWVGSDFLRAVRNMFAYEEDSQRLVVGAGLKKEWLVDGVAVDLRTHYGRLEFRCKGYADKLAIGLSGTVHAPIHLRLPVLARRIELNGMSIDCASAVVIDTLPARLVVDLV